MGPLLTTDYAYDNVGRVVADRYNLLRMDLSGLLIRYAELYIEGTLNLVQGSLNNGVMSQPLAGSTLSLLAVFTLNKPGNLQIGFMPVALNFIWDNPSQYGEFQINVVPNVGGAPVTLSGRQLEVYIEVKYIGDSIEAKYVLSDYSDNTITRTYTTKTSSTMYLKSYVSTGSPYVGIMHNESAETCRLDEIYFGFV